ncbi:MAG: HIRAN domain-containing protein [Hydrogenovibrio sp.]
MLSTWFRKITQRILHPSLSWVLPVKGVYFYETDAVENHGLLAPGAVVTLKPEPDNEFDRHAVQIWLSGSPNSPPFSPFSPYSSCLLGYIPRTHSRRIAWLLQHAQLKTAEIESVYRQYHRLYIYVRLGFNVRWWQAIQYWIR